MQQQLCALAPGEFKPRRIAPAAVAAHAAADLWPWSVDPAKDRLNAEAVVGAVTGLGVITGRNGAEITGDPILVQVSALIDPNAKVEIEGEAILP